MRYWFITGIAVAVVLLGVVFVARANEARLRRARGAGSADDLARAGRTRDDRGRVVKLLDPIPLHALGRDDVIDREALEAIVQQIQPGAPRRRGALYLGLGAGVIVLVGLGAMLVAEGRPAWDDLVSTLTNPAIIACVLGGGVAPWIVARRERRGRLRAVLLNHRRCPHCGYGLTGVPEGDDGLTTCPECACAWRIDAAACADVGPVPQARPRAMVIALALGVAAFLAGIVVFLVMR
jgi:hypothetical protein